MNPNYKIAPIRPNGIKAITLLFTVLAFSASVNAYEPSNQLKLKLSKYGQIRSFAPVGSGELTAWTLSTKNGKGIVLYTTRDETAIISGAVWNLSSGQNVSDAFAKLASQASVPAQQISQAKTVSSPTPQQITGNGYGEVIGKYSGKLPPSMAAVASLSGFTEGKGEPADTVYIIFDPRCTFCHTAYNETRKYVAKGFTIKWIPALALGKEEVGLPLAASILQNPSTQTLDRLFNASNDLKPRVTPNQKSIEQLARNLTFLKQSRAQSTGDATAKVPMAYYLNKQTGQPKMTGGVSEQVILEMIFGRN